jgi:hypothetical protein
MGDTHAETVEFSVASTGAVHNAVTTRDVTTASLAFTPVRTGIGVAKPETGRRNTPTSTAILSMTFLFKNCRPLSGAGAAGCKLIARSNM